MLKTNYFIRFAFPAYGYITDIQISFFKYLILAHIKRYMMLPVALYFYKAVFQFYPIQRIKINDYHIRVFQTIICI